jgi:hypothetical protein
LLQILLVSLLFEYLEEDLWELTMSSILLLDQNQIVLYMEIQKCFFYYFTAYVGIMCLQVIVCLMESTMAYSSVTLFKKGALDSPPQVIKFTSCLPRVGGSLRVLRLPPPLKLVTMI